LKKRYSWSVALAFGVTVFSALRIYQNSLNGIPNNPVIREFNIAAESALLSVLFSVMVVWAVSLQFWRKFFKAVAVLNAVAICVDLVFHSAKLLLTGYGISSLANYEPWGLLLNASMSGCLNASIYPLFDSKEKIPRYLILVSIVLAGRSLPLATLFVGLAASMLAQKRYKMFALAIPSSFLAGFLIKVSKLFLTRGRGLIWTQAYYFFRDHLHWMIGSGLGGFYVIGPVLHQTKDGSVFLWLHSDWMQTLFEQGIIGFIIILGMYLQALWRSRINPQLFAALAAYAMFGVANMPLRYPLSGLFGAFLIRWAFEKQESVA
ncbi:MAG: hypothetical protein ACXWP5_09950, partial [Bdellovibrionota bacterium]